MVDAVIKDILSQILSYHSFPIGVTSENGLATKLISNLSNLQKKDIS
jgi:hypothetical protein